MVDDIDGSDATQTVPFTLDGAAYEIDLSDDNAARLRDEFAPFVAAGRRTGGRKTRLTTPNTNGTKVTTDREHTRAVRAWARDNGWPISDRGRIPSEVLDAHNRVRREAPVAKSRSRSRRKK
ncbi:histone-like nucleoid-structuring protein Lsr2 [Amycolatopsis albispora]|uniref:Nucleoid-associated protein Lsr2 n=1 Tax=Amycolatopsis albispora TaxID=1804986 RepID=A0A344L9S2_9PSEU|nr:Lsr2 family protein [Amycolatopsis albispora]AXB44796.1 nucleoid-associated protein Lsr2 [Amycolatopsis albispora]